MNWNILITIGSCKNLCWSWKNHPILLIVSFSWFSTILIFFLSFGFNLSILLLVKMIDFALNKGMALFYLQIWILDFSLNRWKEAFRFSCKEMSFFVLRRILFFSWRKFQVLFMEQKLNGLFVWNRTLELSFDFIN